MKWKPILMVGLFSKNEVSKNVYRTAADQLAALFRKNKIPIITTSFHARKFRRLTDTVGTILAKRNKFDIAILPLYGTRPSFIWQEIAARLLTLFGKKIILIVHGGSIPERMQENAQPFLKSLQRANMVVSPSAYLQGVLKKYSIESFVIENVLDLSAYTFIVKKSVRPRIMWMRAFEDIYNPAMAVELAMILRKKYADFKMVMAGADKGLLAEIQAMIEKENLQDVIELPGYINLEQKKAFANEYDIFISTNNIDNAPVSIVEFMAMGLPVISTNVGGIAYMIEDTINGLLVPQNDANAMAEKIIELIECPETATRIAGNAFIFSRKFDEDIVLEKWTDQINSLYKNNNE
ncbi:MAG: glycosyltransferase family 4 protein [Chitinophagaceae bacterium]